MWNHSFRLRLDISLNCASVDVEFEVENTSAHTFEYAAALKSHIAVKDVEQQNVKYNVSFVFNALTTSLNVLLSKHHHHRLTCVAGSG